MQGVMINCSKFDCSKKLVDTIFHLFDTNRANVTFLSTGRKSKIICRTCILSSFTFRQKNINYSNCNWSTKVLENVNCSTQFIVKKMVYMYGSQVRGQVYMYGSQVRCTCIAVRLSQVRCTCMAVRLGVRSGVRLGRVVQVMNKYSR